MRLIFAVISIREHGLANTLQAKKRARQATVHRARNMSQRSSMRTSIKVFLKSLESEDKEAATASYREAPPKSSRKLISLGLISGRLSSLNHDIVTVYQFGFINIPQNLFDLSAGLSNNLAGLN